MVNWDHHIMLNYTVNIYKQNDEKKNCFGLFGTPKTISRAIFWLETKNTAEAKIEMVFLHV
jgi:hypothetical protein